MAWYNGTDMEISPKSKSATVTQARLRRVRSFVLRGGRLTEGQKRALDELWPRYGIEPGLAALDFPVLFGNQNPVTIDIGFGNGESTSQMARANPAENVLAVEVHRPGVGHLLLQLEEHRLENVRVACADAVEFLKSRIPDGALAGARLYFPDPWPKKRHHKRRMVQADFVSLLEYKIKSGGSLHMASDWLPYAEHMLQVLEASAKFENCALSGGFCPRPGWRALTKYEARGQRLGYCVNDLIFRKID